MTEPRRLEEMTSTEVAQAIGEGASALFPVGAVEQHADYLPLGTDAFAAVAVAEDVAVRTGAVVVPPLWWGFSPHHMWLAGTITLRPETIVAVVVDVCEALGAHGFQKVVIINGHRVANLPPLQLGAWHASETLTGTEVSLVDLEDLATPLCTELDMLPFGHGDECETAHLLHLRRELVHEELIPRRTPPGHTTGAPTPIPTVSFPPPRWHSAGKTLAEATTGFPSRATAENGARVHQAMVDQLVALVSR